MITLKRNEVLGRAQLKGIDSVTELASQVGTTRQWLSACLNGTAAPGAELLVALCQVLGCRIDDIADYPNELAPVMVA